MLVTYKFAGIGENPPAGDAPQVRFGVPAPANGIAFQAEPSLSASVLKRASEVAALQDAREVQLVAAQQSGFDTLCAMYLVRRILEGRPMRGRLPMLANYATAERQGQAIHCPLPERLSSVVLAAKRRGRAVHADGLFRLFEDAMRRLDERSMNPLYDSVLAGIEEWRPELELLRRDQEEYRRDRDRGRLELLLSDPDSLEVMEALVLDEPRAILAAQWAWQDREASVEARGFRAVLLHTKGQHGVAVAPGSGLPPALQGLAHTLAATDREANWTVLEEGEFGECGLWSAPTGSRLAQAGVQELARAQWVEALSQGSVRVLDCAREMNRAAKDWAEMSTGRLLSGTATGPAEGYYRVVRMPLRPEAQRPVRRALQWHLCRLLLPLVESRPLPPAPERYDSAEGHLLVPGDNGVAVAYTPGGDDLVDRVQKAVSSLAVLSTEADRLSGEATEARGRKEMLEGFVALRSAIAVSGLRGVERFLHETGQETAFEAQRRVWETQLLHRESEAAKTTLARVEQIQAKLDYLGVFAIATAIIAAAEFVAKPLLTGPDARIWLTLGATVVFLASVFFLVARARPRVHRSLAVRATALFAVLWIALIWMKG